MKGKVVFLIRRFFLILAAAAMLLVEAAGARAADWPAFRGPKGDGISSESEVPLHWGPEQNIKWKAPLPAPGNSSPIVSKGKVFLTCATDAGKSRGLYCYDRRTGELLWSQIVPFDQPDPTHSTNPYCGSSPAADGTTIVFRASPEKFELLAKNKLDESSNSTIAISDGEIFLRTCEHLYCIGKD